MTDPVLPAAVTQDQVTQVITALSQIVSILTHGMTGAMTAHTIEWLKGVPIFGDTWSNFSARAKAAFGAFVAACTAAGITVTFSHPGPGHFIFDLDHLTAATWGTLIWGFAQNWVAQQGWYQIAIKPKSVVGPAPAQPPAAGPGGGRTARRSLTFGAWHHDATPDYARDVATAGNALCASYHVHCGFGNGLPR